MQVSATCLISALGSCCEILQQRELLDYSRESDLTSYADIEFIGMSPGEPGSPGSAVNQSSLVSTTGVAFLTFGGSGTARLSRRHSYELKVSI